MAVQRLLLVGAVGLLPSTSLAWDPPEACVGALARNPSLITDISTPGSTPEMFAVRTAFGPFATTGPPRMVLMSTGIADNVADGIDFDYPGGGFSGSDGDRAVLAFDLSVPKGAQSLSFDSNFCSREYPEWITWGSNDVFDVRLTSDGYVGPLVHDAAGNPVTVAAAFDWITDPTELSGTGLWPEGGGDGACTGWLTTTAPCTGEETLHLEFMLYEVYDGLWDSYVLVDNLRFWSQPHLGPPTTVPWVKGTSQEGEVTGEETSGGG